MNEVARLKKAKQKSHDKIDKMNEVAKRISALREESTRMVPYFGQANDISSIDKAMGYARALTDVVEAITEAFKTDLEFDKVMFSARCSGVIK